MGYQKIGFKNGNVLTAEQLIHMEDGIIEAGKKDPSGGGASLPDAAPYQQLVTDGEGKWVAEERLAWSDVVVDFEWDGDKNNPIFDPATDLFLISDSVTSPESLDGATYTLHDVELDSDSEPAVLNASIFEKGEGMSFYHAWAEAEFPEASYTAGASLLVFPEDTEMEGQSVKAGLYGAAPESTAYVAKLKKGTIHTIPEEYLPSVGRTTIYTATEKYLYKDYEAGEKVSKAELAEAAQSGAVVLKNYNGSAYHPAIVEVYESNDFGIATYITYDGNGGTNAFSFYTKEYVAGPM